MTTSVLIVEDEPEFMRRFSNAVLADPGLHLVGAVSHRARRAGDARCAAARRDAAGPGPAGHQRRRGDPAMPRSTIRAATCWWSPCSATTSTCWPRSRPAPPATCSRTPTPSTSRPASTSCTPAARRSARASRAACWRASGVAGHAPPRRTRRRPLPPRPSPLTERETELLRLTAKGLSFETIGELMGISPHTVVAHVKKIYRKLAVHSRGEAVYEANQLGLL